MEKKEDFRYDTGLESLCKAVTSNTERKTRSRFLSMVQEDKTNRSDRDCGYDSFGVDSLLQELRAADANSPNSSFTNGEPHMIDPGPWAANKSYNTFSQPGAGRRKHLKKLRRVNNKMNTNSHLKCNNCVEIVLEELENLDDYQEVEQISNIPKEIPNGKYRYDRRNVLSQNAYGDSLDPCSSKTADLREEQRKRQREKEANANKRRAKSVLIMPRNMEKTSGMKKSTRAQTANVLPGAISSASSRRTDSASSLWSRFAGTLYRTKATPRSKPEKSVVQEGPLKESDFHSPPVSTRVMAFVPPIDIPSDSENIENISQNSRRMSKRKLAPPQPASAVIHISRKPSFENTCTGECTWAYTKKIREELALKGKEEVNDDIRPSNENCETWWAQPRDLHVDSQLLHARRADILRPPETGTVGLEQVTKRKDGQPPIIIRHEKQCRALVEEYVAPSTAAASEIDIDLSDSEDHSKCACFRTFTESVAQLFFSKPIRRHRGHKKH